MFCHQYQRKIQQLENELKQHQHLTALYDQHFIVIKMDAQGQVIEANANAQAILGYGLEEFKRLSFSALQHHQGQAVQEDQEYLKNICQKNLSDSRRIRVYDNQGQHHYLEANFLADGQHLVLMMARDTTQTARQEIEYQAKVEATNKTLAVLEMTPDQDILWVNENFEKISGYQLAAIKGKNYRHFVPQKRQESTEYQQIWQQVQAGKSVQTTEVFLTQSGEEK